MHYENVTLISMQYIWPKKYISMQYIDKCK